MSFNIPNPKLNAVNPHFGSKYADLGELTRTIQPFLSGQDVDLRQTTLYVEGIAVFVTSLVDADGKILREVAFPFPQTSKAQELGSALTYCRRYGIALLFNLVAETDDDGNAAQGKPTAKKSKPKAKPKAAKTPASTPGAQPEDEDW